MINLQDNQTQNFLEDITMSQKLGLSKDLFCWALIEFFGLTNQLDEQADLFIQIINENDKYPYIALSRFVGHSEFNCTYILKKYNLDNISANENIEKLLFKIKLLTNLKEYDKVEKFIHEILSITRDSNTYSNITF